MHDKLLAEGFSEGVAGAAPQGDNPGGGGCSVDCHKKVQAFWGEDGDGRPERGTPAGFDVARRSPKGTADPR